MFKRERPADAAVVAAQKDKGRPTEQAHMLELLNGYGLATIAMWANQPMVDHLIHTPGVAEMPGWPDYHNTMVARPLSNGGVMIHPRPAMGIPLAPNLSIQPSANASGVQYTLNNQILDIRSPLQDLQLAAGLVQTLAAHLG